MEMVLAAMRRTGAPPWFTRSMMEVLAQTPPLPQHAQLAEASFTRAIKLSNGTRLPQAIAHRGYKAEFPENTMAAFKGAVRVGVQALETDIHLTRDGVVVLCHDASLKRCYGVDKKVSECDWKFLSELRTLKEPRQPMPRLEDLLNYMTEAEAQKIWVLLDIKLDNDPDTVLSAIANVVGRVAAPTGIPWKNRILLGCWAARFIPSCTTYMPGFPITNIAFSATYSGQFLDPELPNISFNILFAALLSLSGRRFIREAKAANRPVYAWTVNTDDGWDWCIERGLDGVISDDPKGYVDYLKERQMVGRSSQAFFSPKELQNCIRIATFVWIWDMLFWIAWGFQGVSEQLLGRKQGPKSAKVKNKTAVEPERLNL